MLAGVGVGLEGHADDADRSLIGKGGLLARGLRGRRRGIERCGDEGDKSANQRHCRKQDYVAVLFADFHGK